MNNSLERIIGLAEKLSINTDSNTKSLAELKGYAAGLELLWQFMADVLQQLSFENAEGLTLSLLCNMFGIDSSIDNEQKSELILSGFRRQFGDYKYHEFSGVLSEYGIIIVSSPQEYMLVGQSFASTGAVDNIGRILADYAFPGVYISFSGHGYTFDYWDSRLHSFDDYDNIGLCFDLLDTMI